eukprot:6173390-Pleurochrysis_carterae.AAC.4
MDAYAIRVQFKCQAQLTIRPLPPNLGAARREPAFLGLSREKLPTCVLHAMVSRGTPKASMRRSQSKTWCGVPLRAKPPSTCAHHEIAVRKNGQAAPTIINDF